MFLHEFIHLFVVDSFRASSASSRTDDVYDISCDADIGDGKDGN